MPVKIVVLDGFALNPGDLSWEPLRALGDVEIHDRTAAPDIRTRSDGAAALFTNKTPLRASTLAELPSLRYIGVLATGYDIVDVAAARERGIVVTNIPAYGTDSVAQFAVALLLELCHYVGRHSTDASTGGWSRNPDWSYALTPLVELSGKTMGVIGFGRIGRRVAEIARALGMKVVAHDPALSGEADGVPVVPLNQLLVESDVVSLHSPLTPDNRGLINAATIGLMKPSAFLINTARGPLVVDQDLAEALNSRRLAGAGLDVLSTEPPDESNPLLRAKNCIVTPHIAWATREARARLLEVAVENLTAFLRGTPKNVVS
jgi:glycerate dehydrogenase